MAKIAFRARLSTDEFVVYAQIGMAVFILFLFLCFLISFFKIGRGLEGNRLMKSEKCSPPIHKSLTVGPFALQHSEKSSLSLFLENKLIFLAQSVRPDVENQEKLFCIGMRDSKEQVRIKEGEPISFEMEESNSGIIENLRFASNDATLRLVPHVVDGRHLSLINGEEEIILPAITTHAFEQENLNPSLGALKNAKWWGQDQLFCLYGADKYRSLGQKQKIEIFDGVKRYVLHVGMHDFITFNGGKWVEVACLEDARREDPLAYVQSIGSNGLEIEVWDVDGFTLFQTALRRENTPPPSLEQIITSPKLRSKTQVSCQIGKRKMLLKEGDWLLKTKGGVHKLVDASAVKAYLNHELQGELFVVDQIDPRGILKIHYFNEMRIFTKPLSFPLLAEIKKTKAEKKKAVFLQ